VYNLFFSNTLKPLLRFGLKTKMASTTLARRIRECLLIYYDFVLLIAKTVALARVLNACE